MKLPADQKFFVFDCESVGLHGQTFAAGRDDVSTRIHRLRVQLGLGKDSSDTGVLVEAYETIDRFKTGGTTQWRERALAAEARLSGGEDIGQAAKEWADACQPKVLIYPLDALKDFPSEVRKVLSEEETFIPKPAGWEKMVKHILAIEEDEPEGPEMVYEAPGIHLELRGTPNAEHLNRALALFHAFNEDKG